MSGYGQTVYINDSITPPISGPNLNKTEEGVNAALGYDSLQAIRDLGVPSNSVETVLARGHSACGDGGEGLFFVRRGSVGQYVDDDGITLVPTGGDGSVAYVRAFQDVVYSAWWGTPTDGTDAIAHLERMRDFALANAYVNDPLLPGRYGVVIDYPIMRLSDGEISISRSFWISGGMRLEFGRGAVLKALTLGQTVLRSTTPEENEAGVGGFYSARAVSIDHPIIDGNDLASVGILLDTIAAGSEVTNPRVYKCTGQRIVNGTGTSTAGSAELTVPDSSMYRVLDVLFVSSHEFPYVVIKIVDSTTILLSYNISSSGAQTIQQRGIGLQTAMAQQTDIYGPDVRYNDIGVFFGVNSTEADPKSTTDMCVHGGIVASNKQAAVFSESSGSRFYGTTFQRSTQYGEIVLHRCRGLVFYGAWIEPVDYETHNTNNMWDIPMIRIDSSGYSIQFHALRWSHNPNDGCADAGQSDNCNWRRLMDNEGWSTQVNEISTNLNGLPENPSNPGDKAWFLQRPAGCISVTFESGQVDLDYPFQLVISADTSGVPDPVDANGAAFPDNAYVDVLRQNGLRTAGVQNHYLTEAAAGAGASIRLFSNADFDPTADGGIGAYSNHRLSVRSNGIYIGDGTSTPQKIIGRRLQTYTSPTGTKARNSGWDTETVTTAELARFVFAMYEDLQQHGLWNQT